jgi:hypothetical protein
MTARLVSVFYEHFRPIPFMDIFVELQNLERGTGIWQYRMATAFPLKPVYVVVDLFQVRLHVDCSHDRLL